MKTLRIVRPTDRLAEVVAVDRAGLDPGEPGRFHDHDGRRVALQREDGSP